MLFAVVSQGECLAWVAELRILRTSRGCDETYRQRRRVNGHQAYTSLP